MSTTKRVASVGGAVAGVAIIVAGVWGVGSAINAQPEPTPTPTETTITLTVPADTPADTIERRAQADAEQERIAAEAEAARVAAEQAAAAQAAAEEAARAEAERASQQQQQQTEPPANGGGTAEPETPAPPIKCPAGSVANSNDGYNDTSCFPEICFSIMVPDPNHPECDVAFRP